ncbi:methionine ABC transporter permease [Paenibacillus sp. MBLB4367]|uniref:methionine ABC transporter permease n=1 Tax=Paenibacillus sp. MBLB4367 TaxID=3384767 RepID=UPI0039081C54
MIESYFTNVNAERLLTAAYETMVLTLVSLAATFVLGLLLGTALFLTEKGNVWENKGVNMALSAFVNVFRSIPFIILVILLIPFTKVIVGSILGVKAALPALIIGAAPFYARLVQIAMREVDKGVIEAAKAMGARTRTIILKVLIPESLPALLSGITVTAVLLVGFSAMAGVIGAGGLGTLAYMEGFQRSHNDVTVAATGLILVFVFILQFIGDYFASKADKR